MALTVTIGAAVVGDNISPNFGASSSYSPTIAVGDILLAICSARGAGVFSTPSGWIQLLQVAHSSSNINKIAVFSKVAGIEELTYTNLPTITYSGGAAGDTTISRMVGVSGSFLGYPVFYDVVGSASSNASAANIGPITGITTTSNQGAVFVIGHRADDSTAVATLTGDSLTWVELSQSASSSGNDATLAIDYTLWSGGAKTITDKTFTVSGGSANTGLGIMFAVGEGPALLRVFSDVLTLSDEIKDQIGSVYLGQAFLETLYKSDPSSIVLAHTFLEVLYDGTSLADSLKFWADAVSLELGSTTLPVFVEVDDTLELSDEVVIGLVELLSLLVEEDANSLDDSNDLLLAVNLWNEESGGSFPIWRDELTIQLFVNLESEVADDLDFSDDFAEYSIDAAIGVSDSFTLTDFVALVAVISKSFSDSIDNWDDLVEYLTAYAFHFKDIFRLSDRIQVAFLLNRGVGDTLSLLDFISILSSLQDSPADQLELSDELGIQLNVNLFLEAEDSLDNWYDSLGNYANQEDDDYYRRYLNDRAFMIGDLLQSHNDTFTLRDSVGIELV